VTLDERKAIAADARARLLAGEKLKAIHARYQHVPFPTLWNWAHGFTTPGNQGFIRKTARARAIQEAAVRLGMNEESIRCRLRAGWTLELATTLPKQKGFKKAVA
jgi:hypothetical protein